MTYTTNVDYHKLLLYLEIANIEIIQPREMFCSTHRVVLYWSQHVDIWQSEDGSVNMRSHGKKSKMFRRLLQIVPDLEIRDKEGSIINYDIERHL